MSKNYIPIILRSLLVCGILIAGYLLIKFTFMYFYPFLIAGVLALMLIPVVNRMETFLKVPRTIATLSMMVFVILLLTGSLMLMTTEVFQGTLYLADKMPAYFHSFVSMINTFINTKILPLYQQMMSLFYSLNPDHQTTIIDYIQSLNTYIADQGASLFQNFFLQIPSFLTLLPNSITVIVFIILATFFITNDWRKIQNRTLGNFPKLHHGFQQLFLHFKSVILDYLKAQLILIFITGCLIYSGLLILNIEHAFTISIFIAFIDMLPVVGTGLVFIPWMLYLFFIGDYPLTIGLIIVYMLVVIVRQLLEPKILTSSIGIHPLAGLVILFISIQAFGGKGFLLAPFLLIFLAVLKKSGLLIQLAYFIRGKTE